MLDERRRKGRVAALAVEGDEGATVEVVNEQLGAGSADGPALTVPETATVVNGGSVQQILTSDAEFSVVRIAVEELIAPGAPAGATDEPAPTVESTGAPGRGYQQITLSAPTTEATIVLTIPQALPGSKMATAGADWATNAATQVEWGLGYIQGRYGAPCGAWAHSQAVGWY